MNKDSIARISAADLSSLIGALEIDFVALSECLVSSGHRLDMGGVDASGIHYFLSGTGRLVLVNGPTIEISPHKLVIVPRNAAFRIEAPNERGEFSAPKVVDGSKHHTSFGMLRRFVAGEGDPEVVMICGFFRASYGSAIDFLAALATPIVEQFDALDRLDEKLKAAFDELVAQEVGSGVMSATLLKQVLIILLRRSMTSSDQWAQRFALLCDPQIARAFAEMAAQPGAPHSITSLAKRAGLSRSGFMARFASLLGRPPMLVLRDLRMRQAAGLLALNGLSIEQIANEVGYGSRSSFVRAFGKVYGKEPSEFRAGKAAG